MSRTGSPAVADREWRFQPERTYRIPQSWAENGRHETAEVNEELFYAVQVKIGISLRYGVDATGAIVDGPHRDKPTVRVCYVPRDGCSAYVRDWDAVLDEGGARPERDFASVVAVDPDDVDHVDDGSNRSWYREVLLDRYEVTPIVADGGSDGSDRYEVVVSDLQREHATAVREHIVSSGLREDSVEIREVDDAE